MPAYDGKSAEYLAVEWREVGDCVEDPASPMIGRDVVVLWLDLGEPGPARRVVLDLESARRLSVDLGGVLAEIDAADDDDATDDEADD